MKRWFRPIDRAEVRALVVSNAQRCARLAWPMLAGLVLTGCPPAAPSTYRDIKVDVRSTIQAAALGPGDEFEVRVYEEPTLSGVYVVSPTGQIDYPLLGNLTAEGLSASQIAAMIRSRLAERYLRNPYVTVLVKSLTSKKIFVLGEVRNPGRIAYTERMSIVEAITVVGGFAALAERNYTIVTRTDASGLQRIPVPVEKIMQGRAANFLLQPGDIIYVPETVL